MKRVAAGVVAVVGLSAPVGFCAEGRGGTEGQVVSVETFEQYQPQTFPGQWKARGDEDVARQVYGVTEEGGNRFLHAHAEQADVQIGVSREFRAQDLPWLRWRWRATQLPVGGDERSKETNDSAAAVYVVFDNTVVPRAIKYVWSSSLPVGSRIDSPVYWRSKTVVLQSGPDAPGEWRQETVNIHEDYKNLFGEEPGEVKGIAVLTDADATKSVAEADYDDFTLFAAGALPADGAQRAAQKRPTAADSR